MIDEERASPDCMGQNIWTRMCIRCVAVIKQEVLDYTSHCHKCQWYLKNAAFVTDVISYKKLNYFYEVLHVPKSTTLHAPGIKKKKKLI